MSSAACRMSTLVSFPSKHIRIRHILLMTDQRRLRTINAHGDLVVDGFYCVINTGNSTLNASYSLVNMGYPVVNASHSPVDAGHSLINTGHPVIDADHSFVNVGHSFIDSMRGLQNLCSYHPNLFICQFV